MNSENPNPKETLASLAEKQFFPFNIRLRSEHTRYQYGIAFRSYARFLGHDPTVDDLQDNLITTWMTRLLDGDEKAGRKPLSPWTVRERAGRLQTLWNWMAKSGLVGKFPRFIKPDANDSNPYALSAAQIRALFQSALKERGKIASVPASLWWVSFFAFVWTTSERKTATLSVRPQWLLLEDPWNAKASIPASVRKGRKKHRVYDLWPETVPLLRACIEVDPGREFVWPFPYCVKSYYTRYDRILRDAGIPVNRKTKTHSIRVSHATWREVAGGDATRQLGHGDRSTTMRSYIDATKLPPDPTKLFIPWLPEPDDGAAPEAEAATEIEVIQPPPEPLKIGTRVEQVEPAEPTTSAPSPTPPPSVPRIIGKSLPVARPLPVAKPLPDDYLVELAVIRIPESPAAAVEQAPLPRRLRGNAAPWKAGSICVRIILSKQEFGSPYWKMWYREPGTGKKISRTTKAVNEDDAKAIAAEWEAALRSGAEPNCSLPAIERLTAKPMAIKPRKVCLMKIRESNYWLMYYYDSAVGRQVRRSTGQSDRDKALQIAAQWEAELRTEQLSAASTGETECQDVVRAPAEPPTIEQPQSHDDDWLGWVA